MSDEFNLLPTVGLVIIVVAFGVYVQRIDQRVRAIKNQIGRLSLTFLKIENDLSAIQDSLLVISRDGHEAAELVAKIRERRIRVFRHIVEQGPNAAEILRGLEPPDIDDDPAFWADDRMRKLGLEEDAAGNDDRVD